MSTSWHRMGSEVESVAGAEAMAPLMREEQIGGWDSLWTSSVHGRTHWPARASRENARSQAAGEGTASVFRRFPPCLFPHARGSDAIVSRPGIRYSAS